MRHKATVIGDGSSHGHLERTDRGETLWSNPRGTSFLFPVNADHIEVMRHVCHYTRARVVIINGFAKLFP